MRELVVTGFENGEFTLKPNRVAEGHKCKERQNWKYYYGKIHGIRKKKFHIHYKQFHIV